jgi:hypothetical protein
MSDATVAIFVFSYFRAFVIDSISSHHNALHDKRRGVEDEEQADAEAHDPRGKPLEVTAHGSSSRQITKTRKYENTKKSRTGTLPCLGCQRPAAKHGPRSLTVELLVPDTAIHWYLPCPLWPWSRRHVTYRERQKQGDSSREVGRYHYHHHTRRCGH